jgi:plastocyanin domain-containing protein
MKRLTIIIPLVAALIALAGFTIAQQKKAPDAKAAKAQTAKITIDKQGFQPANLTLKPDVPAEVTFLRTTDDTCATSVIIPEYKIKQDIPLNKPVVVQFTPKKGTFGFACGMNMYQGKLVVQ